MQESRSLPSQRLGLEGSSWPGERQPSYRDVEIANESLEPSFLATFKDALLASSAAQDNKDLMHVQLQNMHPTGGFTYPMSILYSFPDLPSDEEINSLVQKFPSLLAKDALIDILPIPQLSQQIVVPFLKLSLACLACAASPDNTIPLDRIDSGRKLFFAGSSLWNVMLEVDNTEARTLEGALSPMILSLYGALSADVDVWNLVEHQMMPSSSTIARRLRLQEASCTDANANSQPLNASIRSSVMTFLLLVSVLTALHMDIPIYLTSNELGIRLGPSTIHLHQVYTSLLNENSLLDHTWTSYTNPLILLTVILSDSLLIQRSLGKLLDGSTCSSQEASSSYLGERLVQAPYLPLSVPSEHERMSDQLSGALDRWVELFGSGEGNKYLALYFFCRLYLSCPQVQCLPRLANYPPAIQTSPDLDAIKSVNSILISDETISYSWSVLDNIDLESGSGEVTCPTWYPIVVFLAGLIVWARTQQRKVPLDRASSPMQLIAFETQLNRMPWPCCREMASTLRQLARQK